METENKKQRCFVISPIGGDDTPVRQHADIVFSHIISPIAEELDYRVVRSDHISEAGIINNQMFRHLLEDDLIIAILTDHNPNVFYELAICHAAKKPVIQMIQKGQPIPFDTGQYRTIQYDLSMVDGERAKTELRHQILAFRNGINVENPVTAALASLQITDMFSWLRVATLESLTKGILFYAPDQDKYYLLDRNGLFREVPDDNTRAYLEIALGISDELPTVSMAEVSQRMGASIPASKQWRRPLTSEEQEQKELEWRIRKNLAFDYTFDYDTEPQKLILEFTNMGDSVLKVIRGELMPYNLGPFVSSALKQNSRNNLPLAFNFDLQPGSGAKKEIELGPKFPHGELDRRRKEIAFLTIWVNFEDMEANLLFML